MLITCLLGTALLSLTTATPVAQITQNETLSKTRSICYNAALKEGISNPDNDVHELKDLSGNTFYAQLGEDEGFMVFDPVVNNFIEKSSQFDSPYNFSEDHDYYYFGPMNYYERVGNEFYSLLDNTFVDLEYASALQSIFDEQLMTFRSAQSQKAYTDYCDTISKGITPLSYEVGNKTYIDNYQYIRNSKHPSNLDGSCGYVAASLILYYWDRTMHEGTVRPQYLDSNGQMIDTKDTKDPVHNLKDKLVELAGGEASSWGLPVRDALIAYCNEYGISASSTYYIGKFGLDSELRNDRPAIIFGALPDENNNNGLINHAVVAYGIQHEWWGGYYIVNYGWNNKTAEVSLGFGFVGSVCLFNLQGYDKTYTIQPSNYGFPDAYCSTATSKTVTTNNGFTFETTRLRTGYIQKEYITLSPRKEGYGTAYLDYYFTNPVNSIDVDLSYWSDDERYYLEDNPEAFIYYYRLCQPMPLVALDLLTANLPTDRTNQRTYHIDFPGGTRHFRFYTYFENMTGYTDRNKGRISIGPMNISTYW